jgi:predicted ATPase/DNA-binding CsgD family transcriptional regulator/DNA-binding XRE family transcriptional regulator
MSNEQKRFTSQRAKANRAPNERLKAQRLKKNWTQVYVATMIGTSDVEVSRWETGTAVPTLYFREQLCELFSATPEELGIVSFVEAQHEQGLPHASSTLPLPLTSLIGREQEVAEVGTLLRRSKTRLLTLIGTGGVGKTRLALQVVTEMQEDFTDGACFVSLAPLRDAALVLPTTAHALGLQESGTRSSLVQLKAALRTQHLLLVLDNFEHVIEAAPTLIELLAGCPRLKLLVTSREVLHVRGECTFVVQPLTLPDPGSFPERDMFLRAGAVTLFLERAREIIPDVEFTDEDLPLVAEVCRRVDGLPLALELAAARLKLLPLSALLERLEHRLAILTGGPRDLPTRQQTLRNTLAWSYELLSEGEQHLFRLLAIFVGGCTLEAIEAVCDMLTHVNISVLDGITSLLDKHLLYQVALGSEETGERRLGMLETIREYGLECLLACGEMEQTRHAHVQYFLRLAEEAEAHLFGAEQMRWFDLIEREHDNLRAALNWLITQTGDEEEEQRIEMAVRLAGSLVHFWASRGYVSEGQMWLERILKEAKSNTKASLQANALSAAGLLATIPGDYERAASLYKESLKLYQEVGEARGLALSQHWLGWIALRKQGNDQLARSMLEESCAFFRKTGDKTNLAYSLHFLAGVAIEQHKHTEARALLAEGLSLFKEMTSKEGISWSLRFQGRYLFAQGDQAGASALMEESLSLSRKVNYRLGVAYALDLLGRFALAQADTPRAWSLLKESLTLLREVAGVQQSTAYVLAHLAIIATMKGDKAEADSRYRESLALFRQIDDLYGLAFCLKGFGVLIAQQGEFVWAARLWGAAETLGEVVPGAVFLLPVVSIDIERITASVRAELGVHSFVQAFAEGKAMTPEQALAVRGQLLVPTLTGTQSKISEHKTAKLSRPNELTEREFEVLCLVSQGLTDAQIAEALVISPRTVNAHLRSIFQKLGITSRHAAIRYALEQHLV